MRALVGQLRTIQDALDALARRHQVPGATLAVAIGDELFDFATGVLNLNTGVSTTTGSVFQIGSNTKVFTTTLVMQLVDSGQVELDAPVRRYLHDFALADPTAADEITIRQLLTHTSGVQGDYFKGFGRGDEAVERYVASLADVDLIHRPGQLWSYCNSGYVVAGRVAEVVAATPYNQLLKEKICRPLGLEQTTVLSEEAVAQRCAVGHIPGADGKPAVAPVAVMWYSHAPAGSRTTSTAAELVRFARVHVNSGLGPGGEQILSAGSVAAMQQPEVAKPETSTVPQAHGLGWAIEDWDSKRVIGHNGGTFGQSSFLRVVPEDKLVVALLTNSAAAAPLWLDLGRWLFDELAGLKLPTAPEAPPTPSLLPLARYAGTYERLGVRYFVAEESGGLVVRYELTEDFPAEFRPQSPLPPLRLRPIDETRFATRVFGVNDVVVFMEFERGRPGYLFTGGRAARRKGRSSLRHDDPERPRRPARAPGRRR